VRLVAGPRAGAPGAPGADGADGSDCGCPDPFEDDGGVPTPTGEAGDDKRCEVANRVINSILDRLFIPWLTDAAFARYEQGLSDNDLAQQIQDWIFSGGDGPLATDGLAGVIPWYSWRAVVASPLLIGAGVAGITGRLFAWYEVKQ